MSRRRLWIAVGLLAVLVVPAAVGGPSVVSARGVVTGPASDGYMTLTVENTGDEAIRCFRLAVPTSVKVVGARDISPEWRLVSSQAPPAPDIGARSPDGPGMAPGQSLRLVFRTDPPYPPNASATLVASAAPTCSPTTRSTVPAPDTPPPPDDCRCTNMSVSIDPTLLQKRRLPRAKQDFGVGFTWSMRCDAGTGGCRGRVDFLPPKILAGSLPPPKGNFRLNIKRASVNCVGQCAQTKVGRFEIKMRSSRQLNQLFGRTLAFQVRLFCIVDGQPVAKGTRTVRVRVDQTGRLRRA
jgi:hypothetical protein